MELLVQTDLTRINPQEIAFNKDELKAELSQYLDKYQKLVVTEGNIPEAKDARALVNKVRKAIDDEKKRVKKAFTAPYIKFENDVKELLSMCDAVSGDIDTHIKAYEEDTKARKKQALADYFSKSVERFPDFADFGEVFDPRWLNASFDIEEAKAAMDAFAARRWLDVDAVLLIEAEPNVKAMLLSQFRRTKDMADVIRLHNEITARAKAAELAQESRGQEGAVAVSPEPQPACAPLPGWETAPAPDTQPAYSVGNEMTCVTFKITATNAEVTRLMDYMNVCGIDYEEVF